MPHESEQYDADDRHSPAQTQEGTLNFINNPSTLPCESTDNIKLCSLNVCGVKQKLKYPEFNEFIQKFDIIGLSETKLCEYDTLHVDDYSIYYSSRVKCDRNSGGLALLVKNSIAEHVKILHENSDFIQWCCIKSTLTGTDEDLYLGNVYIPPENSKYVTVDMWENLRNEIARIKSSSNLVMLMGDFNSRTGDMPDFVNIDEFVSQVTGLDESVVNELNINYYNNPEHFSTNRVNQDKTRNNFGYKLVETCKVNNMLIANGRLGDDKGVGMVTSKSVSTIDYLIASPQCFNNIENFQVLPFCPILSDIHSPLSFEYKLTIPQITETDTEGSQGSPKTPKWCRLKSNTFIENIDRDKVDELSSALDTIIESGVSKQVIELFTDKLSNIFVQSANKTFGNKPNLNRKKPTGRPSWFGPECRRARSKYHLARKRHNLERSQNNRTEMITSSKHYKRTMNLYIAKNRKFVAKKLRNLKSKDPKSYWSIINKQKPPKVSKLPNLDEFHEYFKEVNKLNDSQSEGTLQPEPHFINDILNGEITTDEVIKAIKSLKAGKAAGLDMILNDYIKVSMDIMVPVYIKLFNLVLDSGHIPDSWLQGVIVPIYKSGVTTNPENYRPITVLSCIGKLFTSILNNRLNYYIESFEILNETQAGFRSGYSTIDNIFVLNALIDVLKSKRKKVYCCFIDFSKAFDKVWRIGLWNKLLKYNINGKFFNVVKNMYENIKSCVRVGDKLTGFFPCECGVRQGENLSPVLFSLYLNDLQNYLLDNDCKGIQTEHSLYTDLLINIIVLLYADDTILISDNLRDLQINLNHFKDYCDMWKLKVNLDKTKVVVFGTRRNTNHHVTLGGQSVEVVNEYKYLGILFNKNRSFNNAISALSMQARKAMFSLFSKINGLELPVDCQLDLFNKTIVPILLYGSEVWGFHKVNEIEKVQAEFIRHVLCVRKSTPYYMLYGETGMEPLLLQVKTRVLNFWCKLICGKADKFSHILYTCLFKDFQNDNCNSKWLKFVKLTLDELGMSNIWFSQAVPSISWFQHTVKLRLQDQYKQYWGSLINSSSKAVLYRIFKTDFQFEKYLLQSSPGNRIIMTKFRTCNNYLPIETGRWQNISRSDRLCTLCDNGDVGDEFHYLFICNCFRECRKLFLKPYYYVRPNTQKFETLFKLVKGPQYRNLCKFVKIIMKHFK